MREKIALFLISIAETIDPDSMFKRVTNDLKRWYPPAFRRKPGRPKGSKNKNK